MLEIKGIDRPDPGCLEKLRVAGSAPCASAMRHRGIRNTHLQGLNVCKEGQDAVAGPALTLQFMPLREDLNEVGEYVNPETQINRLVLYDTQPGDIIVVDARKCLSAGVFGEMMLTYFAAQGGKGVIVDGAIRDWGPAQNLPLSFWMRGVTPNYHAQTDIYPHAANVPIAVCDVLVMPGDIIVGDQDGAVVVPKGLVEEIAEKVSRHNEWEGFSREKIKAGGELKDYYPLREELMPEFHRWREGEEKKP
jgi:regulator of RNase E activity RraA